VEEVEEEEEEEEEEAVRSPIACGSATGTTFRSKTYGTPSCDDITRHFPAWKAPWPLPCRFMSAIVVGRG